MFGFGLWELILIIAIILLLFGAALIPRLMRGAGEGVREFRRALRKPPEEDPDKAEKPKYLPPGG